MTFKVIWEQEHPSESWTATIEELWCGPALGGRRLRVIDEERDALLERLNRLDAPEVRIAHMRGTLLDRGFLIPTPPESHHISKSALSPNLST